MSAIEASLPRSCFSPKEADITSPTKYLIFGLVALTVIVADQVTKSVVESTVPLNRGITVVEGYFNLVHARNPGAAFGMMAGSDSWFRSAFFPLISVVALVVILWLLVQSEVRPRLIWIAYAFFFGGVVGNLIDRIRFGEVVDFLDFHIGSWHWPAFNIADSALCVATGLLFLYFLLLKPASHREG